jgi:hypothetical protein
MQLQCVEAKLPDIKLKTQSKQLLSSLPFDIVLPAEASGEPGKVFRAV